MNIFSGGSGKSRFDKLLEAATSQMLLEPNWAINLEICDSIRQKDVTPKYAVKKIREQIQDTNPNISRFALVVMETCVKNCGQPFHEEINNQEFMSELKTLAQTGTPPVKEQVLTMVQAWNHVFRNKPQFQPILGTYSLLKMEGVKFPVLKESDAMFTADHAPEWKDGDVCHLCRTKFSTFTRQHHCRACGEVFCGKCSSKTSIIPKIGMEREVRVCDTCFDEINPNNGKEIKNFKNEDGESGLPEEYLKSDLYKEEQRKVQSNQSVSQEEDELQLALALSLSEEESNKNAPKRGWSTVSQPLYQAPFSNEKDAVKDMKTPENKPSLYSNAAASLQEVYTNQPELAQYMDRTYWEKKKADIQSLKPSAPSAVAPPQTNGLKIPREHTDNTRVEDESEDSSAFVQTIDKSISMFINRMNEVSSKGKHIAMDSTVQSLFSSLSAMHPQLLNLIEDEEESQNKYEAMLAKLSVIREARESLNDMRAQYVEKTRQQELEQEMLRRMQMEQKLELMRQQKQEYLEYQHVLQLQRQQELEMYQQQKLRERQTQNYDGVIPPLVQGVYSQMQNFNTPPSSLEYQPKTKLAIATPLSAVDYDASIQVGSRVKKFEQQPNNFPNPIQDGSSLQQIPQTSFQNLNQNTVLSQTFSRAPNQIEVTRQYTNVPQSLTEYNMNMAPPPPYEQPSRMPIQRIYQQAGDDNGPSVVPLKGSIPIKGVYQTEQYLPNQSSVQPTLSSALPLQSQQDPQSHTSYSSANQSYGQYSEQNLYKQPYLHESRLQHINQSLYQQQHSLTQQQQPFTQQQQPFSQQQQPFTQQQQLISQQQSFTQPQQSHVAQVLESQQNQQQQFQHQTLPYKPQQQQEPLLQNQFLQSQQVQYQQPLSAAQNNLVFQTNGLPQSKQQLGYSTNLPVQELNSTMKDLQLISFD